MNGQTVDSNHVDGAIYVKIYDHENYQFPIFRNSNHSNLSAIVQEAVDSFGITDLYRSFDFVTYDTKFQKIYRVEFSNLGATESVLRFFKNFSYVEYTEKISLMKSFCTTEINTSPASQTYHLTNTNACGAWAINQGASSVRIGVVDNEFDVNHPDLINKVVASIDLSNNTSNVLGTSNMDHGTGVAGAVAAETNNGLGVASMGRGCNLILAKHTANNNSSWIRWGYEGIAWCVQNGARVVNCSWGSPLMNLTEQLVLQSAENQNVLVVAAAGNTCTQAFPNYPAAFPTVFAVAGTDDNNDRAVWNTALNQCSSIGSWVDISAPGDQIYTTLSSAIGGGYGFRSGTSMAAPIVAGLCGLIASNSTGYTNQQIRNCITSTALDITTSTQNIGLNGLLPNLIDAQGALQCSQGVGSTVAISSNIQALCSPGGIVNFNDMSTIANTPIQSWSWQLPGSMQLTSNAQNPTGIQYNTAGNFDVELTVTDANSNSFSYIFFNYISVVEATMTPITSSDVCINSEIQLNVAMTGGHPPYGVSYSTSGSSVQNSNVNTLFNHVFVPALPTGANFISYSAFDFNGNPIVCPVNENLPISTKPCCPDQIINGDFASGNTGFNSEHCDYINLYPIYHGMYAVSDNVLPTTNNAIWPSISNFAPDRGNSLYMESTIFFTPNYNYYCPSVILPQGTPITNNTTDVVSLWSQNMQLDNGEFNCSFVTSRNQRWIYMPSGGLTSLYSRPTFNITIEDLSNNIVYTSNTVQSGGYSAQPNPDPNLWYQHNFSIPANTIPSTGTYKVSINNVQEFGFIQFLIDDIKLQRTCTDCSQAPTGAAMYINPTASIDFSSGFPTTPIIIHGSFNVDQNLTISANSNIFLGPNAVISVQPGIQLTIDDSHLQGCSDMWNGILAQNPTSKIDIRNSLFEDMEFGVQVKNGSHIYAADNTFTDNYLGMQITDAPLFYGDWAGNCIIKRNRFTSSGSALLPPYQTQSKGEIGVRAKHCRNVTIGVNTNLPTDKNVFENLYCGVDINPDGSTLSGNYEIINNDFINIHNDPHPSPPFSSQDNVILSNIYNTHRGAGVACLNHSSGWMSMKNIYVRSPQSGGTFNNCDKAIAVEGMNCIINDNTVFNTPFGFMMGQADGHYYSINNNLLSNNLFHGVQIQGQTSNVGMEHNHIGLRPGPIPVGYNNASAYPIGIEVSRLAPDASGLYIGNHTIASDAIGGAGIRLLASGQNTEVMHNSITFTSTDLYTGFGSWGSVDMTGIGVAYGSTGTLAENTIQGIPVYENYLFNNPNPSGNRNMRAIKIEETPGMTIQCNHMDNFHEGLYARGNCWTTKEKVASNDFNDHIFPIHLRHLGIEGTLGDIGAQAENNRNLFHFGNNPGNFPAPHNNQGFRVFRSVVCNALTTDKIYSNNGGPLEVQQAQSGSSAPNMTDCRYIVQNNVNPTYPPACATSNNPMYIISPGGEVIDIPYGIDIAMDQVLYPEFYEVADWWEERRLYAALDEDPVVRNNYPALSSFYNMEGQGIIGELFDMDGMLINLNDSLLRTQPNAWQNLFTLASQTNGQIVSTEIYEQNESTINGIYLKVIELGYDALNPQEINTISTLANSCPFTEGTAVIKARMMNAHFVPGKNYDDIAICNAVGIYKTGSPFDKEDDIFKGLTGKNTKTLPLSFNQDKLTIFPNPTSGVMNIEYNIAQDCIFEVYEMSGRLIFKTSLQAAEHTQMINLPPVATGVYTYKVAGSGQLHGKIVVE